MNTTDTSTETETVETAPAKNAKRHNLIAAAAVLAVLGVGIGGYALHQTGVAQGQKQGVQQGEARSQQVAMTELQALQIRGDARVAEARRETRIPGYMRAAAGVTAAENKLFGWADEGTGCRFIRTPEGRIFQDVGPMDLREVLDGLPTQSCRTPA